MDEDWIVVPAQVKGGIDVTMAIDRTDVVALWDSPDGAVLRHSNGGTTLVHMRAAEVAALLRIPTSLWDEAGEWFRGVAP